MAAAMREWTYPLHFIDFETSTVAIPFSRGRRPYETVAFQFSHHVMHADGRIEHRSQALLAQPGVFPNFAFVRALRDAHRLLAYWTKVAFACAAYAVFVGVVKTDIL